MKFLDLINEEEYRTPEQQRELKKAKTLFKALQTGVIKINHPLRDDGGIILRYQIHDNVTYRWEIHGNKEYITIITNNIPGEGITIETDSEFAKRRYEKDSDSVFSEHMRHSVSSSIRRKFINFGINVHINQSGIKFVFDKPEEEPINENEDKNRLISKAQKINKVFRKGFFTMNLGDNTKVVETKFRYELPEKSYPSVNDSGLTLFYRYNGDIRDKIGQKFPLKIWQIKGNGEEELLNDKMTNGDYASIQDNEDRSELSHIFNNVLNYVQRRYRDYGVFLNLFILRSDKSMELNESVINEGVDNIVEDIKTEESSNLPEENLKELKKGKTILKALKKGKIDIGWKDEKYDISYDITNVYFYWETYSNKEVFHMEVTNMDIYVEDVKLYNSLVKKTDDSLWDIWNKDSFRNILSRHIGRRFKNFKISSHVSDARLNFILVKPETINEELYRTPEQKRQEKKAKTLFKALKTGLVKISYPLHEPGEFIFRYSINDNVFYRWETYDRKEYIIIITNNRSGEGINIETDNEWVIEKLMKKTDTVFSNHLKAMVKSAIMRKFGKFNVSIHVSENGMNFVLKEPEQESINEVSEELVNKKIQRGRAIYKLLKTGLIGSKAETDEPMFKYELSDDPSINYRDDLGLTIFVDRVKINQLNRAAVTASIGRIQSKIDQRFEKFDITLINPSIRIDDMETNIIEEMDNKMDKKVKVIYTAFKTGIVKGKVNQNDKYRYVLSDDYTYNVYKQTLSGRDVAVVTPSEGIKVYYLQQNGEEILLPQSSHPNTYRHVLDKISNKTGQYNIYIEVKL